MSASAEQGEEEPPAEHGGTLPARLFVSPCALLPFDLAELTSILAAELPALGLALSPPGTPFQPNEVRLFVDVPDCGGPPTVRLRVEIAESGGLGEREVDLLSVAIADRPRILAIAAAELVRGARSRPEREPDPTPELPEPPPPSPQEDMLSESERAEIARLLAEQRPPRPRQVPVQAPLFVDVALEGRVYASARAATVGLRLGPSFPVGRVPLRLEVDLAVAYGAARDTLGFVDVLPVAVGLTLLYEARSQNHAIGIGLRGELGWAWLRGRAFDPSTTTSRSGNAPWATASGRFAARFRAASWVWLTVVADVGYVVATVEAEAEGRAETGLSGPFVHLGFGGSFVVAHPR